MLSLRKPFADRWWYWAPTQVSYRWKLRVFTSADEYCNPTVYIQYPFTGALIIRIGKTLRAPGNPCKECVTELGPWCDGCDTCHEGPRCHRWIDCDHEGSLLNCPGCGGLYCTDCELRPGNDCPAP